MRDERFEWDDAKATTNFERHGVSFEAARGVFDDPFLVERPDDRHDYGEARYTAVGLSDRRLISVAYTMRGERLRIISVRLAEPRERRSYHG